MSDELNDNATDYIVATAKAALGMVPFAGSLLAELAGSVIPKQRVDRLVDFARRLESAVGELDQDAVRAKLIDENFTDLLEETARNAAQAVTAERREYLASLLASGVTEAHWASLDISDTFDGCNDAIGGVEWEEGDLPRSSSERR